MSVHVPVLLYTVHWIFTCSSDERNNPFQCYCGPLAQDHVLFVFDSSNRLLLNQNQRKVNVIFLSILGPRPKFFDFSSNFRERKLSIPFPIFGQICEKFSRRFEDFRRLFKISAAFYKKVIFKLFCVGKFFFTRAILKNFDSKKILICANLVEYLTGKWGKF